MLEDISACRYPIKARITEFPLTETQCYDDATIVPVVKGSLYLKYGKHAYYFYNFKSRQCICVEIGHWDIIAQGLSAFIKALGREDTFSTRVKLFLEKYHYGFSFLEQIMLMT